jgi:beta-1,4-mannosyl-glycoprotein beta-1,4-N-acetylglucosaminyltransferase
VLHAVLRCAVFHRNSELDMMEIRLEELHSVVDRIFVLESRQTFRGKPKPLAFPHVLPRLRAEVIAKVHYTVLDTLEGDDPWQREHYQRGQMVAASLASAGIPLDPQDVLIMSDLDEIPKPEFIRAMKQCNIAYPISLNSVFHYYSFNYVNGQSWSLGPTAMQAWQAHSMSPQLLRSNTQWDNETDFDNVTHYSNAAWHCRCVGQGAAGGRHGGLCKLLGGHSTQQTVGQQLSSTCVHT